MCDKIDAQQFGAIFMKLFKTTDMNTVKNAKIIFQSLSQALLLQNVLKNSMLS